MQAGIAAFAMAMPEAPPEETEEVAPELAIPELHSVVEGSVPWLGAEAGGNPVACEVCFTFLAGKNIGHIMTCVKPLTCSWELPLADSDIIIL